jgi:hypothetical protein
VSLPVPTFYEHRDMMAAALAFQGPGEVVTHADIVTALTDAGIFHRVWELGPRDWYPDGVNEVIIYDCDGYIYGFMPGRTLENATRDGIRVRPTGLPGGAERWVPTIADMIISALYIVRPDLP